MNGSHAAGVAKPMKARDLIDGDIVVQEGELDWIEYVVLGIVVDDEDQVLAVMMDAGGHGRVWTGAGDARHFVIRNTTGRSKGRFAKSTACDSLTGPG